jgi:hypothetical protein
MNTHSDFERALRQYLLDLNFLARSVLVTDAQH